MNSLPQATFEPLSGITVLSLAVNLPGPLAAARLAALGARVIKVEPPTGDPLNAAAPAYYRELTVGQHILTLDLKTPEGQADLRTLAADARILLTAHRPAVSQTLGLTQLVEEFGLVHVEIVGFNSPHENHPGHDLTYQAAHATLRPGSLPTVPIADYLGGEHAALAALAGLRVQDQARANQPTQAEVGAPITTRVTLDDAAAWAAGAMRHGLTSPRGPLGGGSPLYRTYATADGHIALACLEPHFARRLAQLVGETSAQVGQTSAQAPNPAPPVTQLDAATLEGMFASQPTAHWVRIAREQDLPIEEIVVHTGDTAANSPAPALKETP